MIKFKFIFFKIILLSLIFTSCKTFKTHIDTNYITYVKSSQTIFLTFSVEKSKEGSLITLLNKEIKNVFVNISSLNANYSAKNRFRFIFCDINNNKLDTIEYENPLFQRVETFQENGSMTNKTYEHDKTTFDIRFPFLPSMKYILIEEIIDKKIKKAIRVEI